MSVCLSARVSQKPQSKLHEIFCTCCQSRGSTLTTVQYVMYFRFCGDVMLVHNGSRGAWPGRVLKVTHQGAAPGAKCDVDDCLVFFVVAWASASWVLEVVDDGSLNHLGPCSYASGARPAGDMGRGHPGGHGARSAGTSWGITIMRAV